MFNQNNVKYAQTFSTDDLLVSIEEMNNSRLSDKLDKRKTPQFQEPTKKAIRIELKNKYTKKYEVANIEKKRIHKSFVNKDKHIQYVTMQYCIQFENQIFYVNNASEFITLWKDDNNYENCVKKIITFKNINSSYPAYAIKGEDKLFVIMNEPIQNDVSKIATNENGVTTASGRMRLIEYGFEKKKPSLVCATINKLDKYFITDIPDKQGQPQLIIYGPTNDENNYLPTTFKELLLENDTIDKESIKARSIDEGITVIDLMNHLACKNLTQDFCEQLGIDTPEDLTGDSIEINVS